MPWDTELGIQSSHNTPKHFNPEGPAAALGEVVLRPSRPAFASIFWPVLLAILAAMLIIGTIGGLISYEIIHQASKSVNDQINSAYNQ